MCASLLYATAVVYQVGQLRHRTILLRYVRDGVTSKTMWELDLPELPDDMHECEAILSHLREGVKYTHGNCVP